MSKRLVLKLTARNRRVFAVMGCTLVQTITLMLSAHDRGP